MPSMASIIVKGSDGVTDVTFDALSASGGDDSPAVWRRDTGASASLPVGLRAMFKVLTKWNGPKTARQMKVNFVRPYPVQDSTTTLWTASDRVVFDGIVTLPQAMPAGEIKESVHLAFNLMAAALIKQIGETGYSAS